MNKSNNNWSNHFVYTRILLGLTAMGLLLCAVTVAQASALTEPVFRHSEVVFMYAADDDAYRAYNATFVAWGGANTAEQVKRHHEIGVRCTGSMWCLTAGAEKIHKNPALRESPLAFRSYIPRY